MGSCSEITRKHICSYVVVPSVHDRLFNSDRSNRLERFLSTMANLQSEGSLPSNYKLDKENRYVYERQLGRGSYGVVVAARDTCSNNGEVVAIKLIKKTEGLNGEKLRREIRNLKELQHHHIVKFIGNVETDAHFGIVMEYVPNGTLEDYMKKLGGLPERLVRFFFQQVVLAVDYFHSKKIFNRDIKVENILVREDNPEWPVLKICDFGFSKSLNFDSLADSQVGTTQLLPPEIVDLVPGHTYDGYKADIWCLGLFLYRMITGVYPFSSRMQEAANPINIPQILQRIRNVEYDMPSIVPEDYAEVIRKILVSNPADRPTIKQIQEHRCFQTNLPDGAINMNTGQDRNNA